MTTATLDGKPDAGNPHVRFGEGEVAPAKPRRGSLLYRKFLVLVGAALAVAGVRADAALGGDAAAVSPADFGGTDSVRIEKAIARACETGVRTVTVPATNAACGRKEWLIDRAILLPDDFTLELDDCVVRLVPGVRDNLIRNVGAVAGAPTPNRNIRVVGRGRATLSAEGPARYDPPGDKGGWRSIGVLFCRVKGFEVRGVTMRESQSWGWSFEYCTDGLIRDLHFEDSNAYPNQDGVDIRKGCHDIRIENLTGVTGDDTLALTGILHAGRLAPEAPYDDSPAAVERRHAKKERYAMQISGSLLTKEFTGDYDIHDITVKGIWARSCGGHSVVRILVHDGMKAHHIRISDVTDTTSGPDEKRALATVRIGDTGFVGKAASGLGDYADITVENVRAAGKAAVSIRSPLKDSAVTNVTCACPDMAKYDIVARTENVRLDARNLRELVREDLRHEVHPGGVEGRPFWNGQSMFFMYPPSFDFPADPKATHYRFDVVDAKGHVHFAWGASPHESLASVWPELPTGWTSVSCRGMGGDSKHFVLTGTRAFWKQAPFTGNYPPAVCGYGECAERAKRWLYSQESFTRFLKTRDAANCGYWGLTYPSKMAAAVIRALTAGEPGAEDLATARVFADWIISLAEPADRPLAYFTPTYFKTNNAKRGVTDIYFGQTMLIYPAEVGEALVLLYARTKDEKYLAHAKGIAETYLRLQGEDGTWYLKMYLKDAKPVCPNRLVPIECVTPFLEALYKATGDARYRAAADRTFEFIRKGPLTTWNWEGQFEDAQPDEPYRNLTKHAAASTAIYLLNRFPGDKAQLALARELLRFAEDQFVCWEKPFPDMPFFEHVQNVQRWRTPCVLEQYYWYVPIDGSASKLIRTYLALYRAEGNPLDLAKAKALGDSMTRVQNPEGDIPTHWKGESHCSWWNCLLCDVEALQELEQVIEGK